MAESPDANPHRIFRSVWVTWFLLTAVYLLLYVWAILGTSNLTPLPDGGVWGRAAAFVGLFVPFGFWNTLFAFSGPLQIISIPTAAVLMGLFEKAARRWSLSIVSKLTLNLAVLFVVTLLVDLMIYHGYRSLDILLTGQLLPRM